MGRPPWVVELIKKTWPTRFASARAANVPVIGRWMERTFFQGDQMTQIPINRDIEGADRSVALPLAIVEEFVREASVRVIMHACICRDSNHCKGYPVHTGCVFLGEAARGINTKLAKQAGVEETLGHIKDAVASGLVPFMGRNKLDTVWLGAGPGDRLLTICLCCPCCCLYGIYRHFPEHMRHSIVKLEGLELEVTDLCTGCGRCTTVCLSEAIRVPGARAEIDEQRCIGCGRCAGECPEQAIRVWLSRRDTVEACKQRVRGLVRVT
ncbi:MAG: 4Fe-4S binding protein [bacterium]